MESADVAGPVYLVASGQHGLLSEVAARAVRDLGKPHPRIAVTYAPVDGDDGGLAFMSGRMGRLFPGATIEAIEHDAAVVRRADLIFVSGGDPTLGAKVLARTGAGNWIRDAAAGGVPTMGVSAGTILLGAWWVDWPDDEDAPADVADLVACLGVLPDYVFDTHDEADDWEELRTAASLLRARGIEAKLLGIPSGGALVFGPPSGVSRDVEIVGDAPFELG
jgi:hypothetical protein